MLTQRKHNSTGGYILVYLLVIIFIFSMMMLPFIEVLVMETRVLHSTIDRESALQIAEAGVNYYQWHLSHFPTDYQDGTASAGPYVHDYTDADTGTVVGRFSLSITPPLVGSTIVTIQSTGYSLKNPGITRTVTAKYGIPSLAKYSFLSNGIIWIGDSESVSGQMQSNNGIRFDGVGNAPIQSAKSTYTCPSSQGSPCPAVRNGIWGSASAEVKSFWQFPVPAVDFSSLTSDLATMKSAAEDDGIYLPPSNSQGYSLVFNSNGTVSVYKVTSLKNTPRGYDVNGAIHDEDNDYDHTNFQFTLALPSNGIIYIEDKIWVEGTVNGRIMVAAAKLPLNLITAPTIYIPNNIVYLAKDGTNTLGLLAQKDIVVTYRAPLNLEIDAALIAQYGSTQFLYYPSGQYRLKNSITVFGSIMSFGQWTWSWVTGPTLVSGYANTNSTYDANLLYAPPPSFPISNQGYQTLNWQSN